MLCTNCKKYSNCSTICTKVKKILTKDGIKSSDWIRPERSSALRGDGKGKYKEIPMSALTTQDKQEFKKKYGDIDDF